MADNQLIPHLFRTEYRKIISVLCKAFGMENLKLAEDITSDTFLLAAETWGLRGLPPNPVAWLYTVAKNKAKDALKREQLFAQKIAPEIKKTEPETELPDIDLSKENIRDSQLQMMFAICNPIIPMESQIGLSLNILCGFGSDEIASAFISNRETIYKRLARAKEKLRSEKVQIKMPQPSEIPNRLEAVLTTLYLLFSEGYYSGSQNKTIREELCLEAMRLNLMLTEEENTNTPAANALLALMCFHASRFEARINPAGQMVLYEDQDESLWNTELMKRGEKYLNRASTGDRLSKYHLEAAIAYWHTKKEDSKEKWEHILQYYNRLLQLEYSPIAALNRTYALAKAGGFEIAISEAEKLDLKDNYLYHSLLGYLHSNLDKGKALNYYQMAMDLCQNENEKTVISGKMEVILGNMK